MKLNNNNLQGLALLLLVALVAFTLGSFTGISAILWAILLGMLYANAFPKSLARFREVMKFGEKTILGVAIILMGLQISWSELLQINGAQLLGLVAMMAIVIVLGFLLRRLGGGKAMTGPLLGIGHAVCGNAAIAAAAPVLKADGKDVGLSIAVINLLGTAGLVAIPALGHILFTSDVQSGFFAGSTLQAVGHAVAAGKALGDVPGQMATLIKLSRVALLGPVLFLLAIFMNAQNRKNGLDSAKEKFSIPFFLYGFAIALILANVVALPVPVLDHAKNVETGLLIIAMTALGANIRFSDLLTFGPRALAYGVVIFGFQIALMAALLVFTS